MNISEVKQVLRGPMIPVITNLHEDLSVDHGAIRENVRYVIEGGIVQGQGVLLAAGAGGDFPMLSLSERKEVCKTIVDEADGRVPVLVGAQDTNPTNCFEMARLAEDIGAYGIQMSPGYYYASSEEDCLRYFESVHEQTRSTAIMIYNTYWEGFHMSLDLIARLAEMPRCVALKWSTPQGSADYLKGVERLSDRLAIVDNQGLHVMTHLLGGTGYITHLATIWPEHDSSVWQLMEKGDYSAAQRRIAKANWPWQEFRGKMWGRTAAESPVVKAALELCGRPGGPNRLPTRSLNQEERDELRRLFEEIGVPSLV